MNKNVLFSLVLAASISCGASHAEGGEDRFISNGDGTVTDLVLSLMWQVCSTGQVWHREKSTCEGVPLYVTSVTPVKENSEYAGYDDWRLPLSHELESLVVCMHPKNNDVYVRDQYTGCKEDYLVPTISSKYFPNTKPVKYWSSTTNSTGYGESVSFRTGSKYIDVMSDLYAVRLVRYQ